MNTGDREAFQRCSYLAKSDLSGPCDGSAPPSLTVPRPPSPRTWIKGDTNSEARKQTPTVTATRPVRPPSLMPTWGGRETEGGHVCVNAARCNLACMWGGTACINAKVQAGGRETTSLVSAAAWGRG